MTLIVRHVGGVLDLREDIETPRFVNSIEPDFHPYVKEAWGEAVSFIRM
jgi:hypothetical protein